MNLNNLRTLTVKLTRIWQILLHDVKLRKLALPSMLVQLVCVSNEGVNEEGSAIKHEINTTGHVLLWA